jgi:predicted house-cleaning noncanonical NTP pyrophosphatase (MazG superfamily)
MNEKTQKLVRDKIPDIIRADGAEPVIHVATDEEYWAELKKKLHEEADEFTSSENTGEIADILEVLEAMLEHRGMTWDAMWEIKRLKAESRGTFTKRIILVS